MGEGRAGRSPGCTRRRLPRWSCRLMLQRQECGPHDNCGNQHHRGHCHPDVERPGTDCHEGVDPLGSDDNGLAQAAAGLEALLPDTAMSLTTDELDEIDRYATDAGINLWKTSSDQ